MVDVIFPPLSISSIVVSLWLAGCLAKSTLIGWREYYGGGGVGVDRHLCGAQQTRAFDPMLFQYWPTANGAGPTLKQHWVESSCLLEEMSAFWYTRAVCVWSEQAAQCSVYYICYIWIPIMGLWPSYVIVYSFSAGIDFRRQNLTCTRN